VKERKQAEFLLHARLPFDLVERIGVQSRAVQATAVADLRGGSHRPPVEVRPEWYY